MTASNSPAPAEARTVSAVSLADWGQYMDAGAVTYAVGEVPGLCTVYLDRAEAEAEAAADELKAWGPRGPSASYAEWVAEGRQPEPEAGP